MISKRISRKKFRVLRGRREIATNSVTSETRAGGKEGRLVESHAEQGFRVTREVMRIHDKNGGSPRQGFGELTSS